jgi:hypothetical protein
MEAFCCADRRQIGVFHSECKRFGKMLCKICVAEIWRFVVFPVSVASGRMRLVFGLLLFALGCDKKLLTREKFNLAPS